MKKIIIYLIIMILSYNGFSSTLQDALGVKENELVYSFYPTDGFFFYKNSVLKIDTYDTPDIETSKLHGEYTYNIRTEKK